MCRRRCCDRAYSRHTQLHKDPRGRRCRNLRPLRPCYSPRPAARPSRLHPRKFRRPSGDRAGSSTGARSSAESSPSPLDRKKEPRSPGTGPDARHCRNRTERRPTPSSRSGTSARYEAPGAENSRQPWPLPRQNCREQVSHSSFLVRSFLLADTPKNPPAAGRLRIQPLASPARPSRDGMNSPRKQLLNSSQPPQTPPCRPCTAPRRCPCPPAP